MTTTLTTTGAKKLKINKLTKTQLASATLSSTEMYLVDPEFTGDKLLVTDSNGDIAESTLLAPSKWISKSLSVYNNVTLSVSGSPTTYTPDISGYLPTDNAQYEVIAIMHGNAGNLNIDTDVLSDYAGMWTTVANRQQIILVFKGSTASLSLRVYEQCTSFGLYFRAYRRIG